MSRHKFVKSFISFMSTKINIYYLIIYIYIGKEIHAYVLLLDKSKISFENLHLIYWDYSRLDKIFLCMFLKVI